MCADERKKGTNMQYRVVFSDIDGTLLNSKHQVTPDTRLEILSLEQKRDSIYTSVGSYARWDIDDPKPNWQSCSDYML